MRAQGPPHPRAYAWLVVAVLWPVVMLNYLDRQMLATVRVSVRADIPSIASDRDFGMLMAVFLWVYALLSPLGGFLADKFSRRWAVIGSLFVWSAATYLTGLAESYRQMLGCRALMGLSEAFYFPAALSLIADYHPGHTRSRAVGVHQSGLYAGLALGGIGGYIAQSSSWRNCFTWFGAAGMGYALILLLFLRDPPPAGGDAAGPPVTLRDTLRALGRLPAFWLLAVYFTLPAIAVWATRNWLPTYLADTFRLREGPAGLSATGYIQLASFAGVLLGGMAADAWRRVTPRGYVYTSALGTLLLAPALLGLGGSWSLTAAIAFMLLFGLGWGLFDCNNMPILCQIVRPEHWATGYGLLNLASISVGAGVTVVLGWMHDRGASFSAAFAICAALALFSAGLILRIPLRDS
jgi:predicted MFS family arabinose efflux permease